MRAVALCTALSAAPISAAAHQLVVFASADCDAITVEAKFSSGKLAQKGEVRVLDGKNNLLITLDLESNGKAELLLTGFDYGNGLTVEVDTGGHENYWILTAQDIESSCQN